MSASSVSLGAHGGLSVRSSPSMRSWKVKCLEGSVKTHRPEVSGILMQAFLEGYPSVRFLVRGQMYKFDFVRMQEKNLMTGELKRLLKPLGPEAPPPPLLGVKQLGPRPVFAFRVPKGGSGKTVRIPHPKQRGKFQAVPVPAAAKEGEVIFVPMESSWKRASLLAGCGAAGGAAGTALLMSNATAGAAGAGAAVAGGVAAVGSAAAPFLLGGLAVAGVAAGTVATARLAQQHPIKATAAAALLLGGAAAADHAAEHGVAQAAGDFAEGAGDAAEVAGDVVEAAADARTTAGHFVEALASAGEDMPWWEDGAAPGEALSLTDGLVDFVDSLYS